LAPCCSTTNGQTNAAAAARPAKKGPTPKTRTPKPSPSQLVQRLHGHAGPAGRRGTPGAGEEAQTDARGRVEAALEERGFRKLRRWACRRMLVLRRGCRGHVELSSRSCRCCCCCCCCWKRRGWRRRARRRGRRRHLEREGGREKSSLAGELSLLARAWMFFFVIFFLRVEAKKKSFYLEKKGIGFPSSLPPFFLQDALPSPLLAANTRSRWLSECTQNS